MQSRGGLKGMLIYLDAGHSPNGHPDPGAVSKGLREADITGAIVDKLINKLSVFDVWVKQTSRGSLRSRTEEANNEEAQFFLSVHVNAGGGTGFESYVHTSASLLTRKLQQTIHNKFMQLINEAIMSPSDGMLYSYGVKDRGMKQANFAVLRETKMPAVLVEIMFIDNQNDAELLRKPAFLNDAADALCSGLVKAFDLKYKQTPKLVWDPTTEIEKLRAAGLINAPHHPADTVLWGEFATVMNRLRGG
ncbi:MAG: N-acetylmuramoyl-L-alanine amidase [Peptococcaceae bacterium]|jgi:N-acetylmuramoyl-L-alanine amidase|nr:MAG: N-acetylmuramoyl-L-alanine amidase [Peptococcaceae bacterium]